MTRSLLALAVLSLAASSTAALAIPVGECSARFFAAQRDGSLNGRDWTSFRQGVCGAPVDEARSPAGRTPGSAVPSPGDR
jgi:hypothetical protein